VRIPKSYIGQRVELVWRDPCHNRVDTPAGDRSLIPRGYAALATWTEYGILEDITDGVVVICHSIGEDPSHSSERRDALFYTWTHEMLVTKVTILDPRPTAPEATP